MPAQIVKINYTPHLGQVELHRALKTHRFTLACCGRRWGKTHALSIQMAAEAIANRRWKAWWVDPSFPQAERVYFDLKRRLPKYIVAKANDSRREIRLINESVMRFESAEKEDNLLGEGLDRMMVNEASIIKEDTWMKILRPMLVDRLGRLGAAFTPRGQQHWTYRLWLKGQQGGQGYTPGHCGLQFPSHSNPRLAVAELAELAEQMPESLYRQEILAEFLPDSSGVFFGITDCMGGQFDEWLGLPLNGPYVGGLDLARKEDFSVLVILDKDGHCCWKERFNTISWESQRQRIVDVAKKYNAHLVVDDGSVGDVITEDIRAAGVSCEPFNFVNKSKAELIQRLQVAIERKEVSWPLSFEELTTELRIYQYEITAARNIRYSAPPGFHDDCVVALALAVWGKKHSPGKVTSYLGGMDVGSFVVGAN